MTQEKMSESAKTQENMGSLKKKCAGMNCESPASPHSPECIAEHAAAAANGRFVKHGSQPPSAGIPKGWMLVERGFWTEEQAESAGKAVTLLKGLPGMTDRALGLAAADAAQCKAPDVTMADFLAAAPQSPSAGGSEYTYASKHATSCAGCGIRKHTPLRVDEMDGHVCLTCIDNKLEELFSGETVTQARISSALALLRDDSHAATFQSLGQYRSALIKALTLA